MTAEGSQKSGLGWGELLGLLLLVGALGLMMFRQGGPISDMPVPAGVPLPKMMAEGWLNVEAADGTRRTPSRNSLRGRVVVIDNWATWCAPCRAAMPELARLYREYRPMGVEFIGLTPEGESELSAIKQFIGEMPGFDWPVGFGASPTIDMLGIQFFPTLIVFGPDGSCVWSSFHTNGLADALDKALATVPAE